MSLTYKETLHYLFEQLPMFQRVGAAAYRNNLDNIIRLCELLGNPQKQLKCIHVAGTNGKGSVTHIIASVLQEQGYKVGVFVSPHYKDYRERIKINGSYISRQFVQQFVTRNITEFKEVDASFFEITTAMAFDYFKKKKVDFAVIETGMGGRLDSTNIITPLLSVITNISYDHQQFLGNTLTAIAKEKAGIIKHGVPVVIGETHKETKVVFVQTATKCKSSICFADTQKSKYYRTDLKGAYQEKNIQTALTAVHLLRKSDIIISEKSVRHGIGHVTANTSFMGRWMVQGTKPLVVFDSAHNEGGWKEVMHQLREMKYAKLHIVFGTVADKDLRQLFTILPKQALYYYCKADIPRAMEVATLLVQAELAGFTGIGFPSVKKAYTAALKNAKPADLVLVAGSVFVIAELL